MKPSVVCAVHEGRDTTKKHTPVLPLEVPTQEVSATVCSNCLKSHFVRRRSGRRG